MVPSAQENRAIHRPVVLEGPADFPAPEAEALAPAQELEVQEGVDAPMAKFGANAERHDARLVDAPEPAHEPPETERKQPTAAHLRERLIDVQKGQTEGDRPPVDLRDHRALRLPLEQRPELLGRVDELGLGERDEPPVASPRGVVDLHGPPDLGRVVPEVHRTHDDAGALPHDLGHAPDLLGNRLTRPDLPGIEILRLGEAEALEQPGVVRRVVRHSDHRRLVEALDQEAALLVGGVRRGTAHDLHATRGEPARGGGEQRVGDGAIVLALETAEEPDPVVVKLVVRVIDDRLDAAHRPAGAPGQEERAVSVAEERVASPVEQLAVLAPQRWHEVRTAPVKTVREVDELAPGLAFFGGDDLEGRHLPSVARRRRRRAPDIY